MSGLQVLDRYRIELSKPGGFPDKELFTAKCLGFTADTNGKIVVDGELIPEKIISVNIPKTRIKIF